MDGICPACLLATAQRGMDRNEEGTMATSGAIAA